MGDQAYYEHLIEKLEQPYLDATDVRAQSGLKGDAELWEKARRVITAPMTRDGTWLDIGCANGHLMETVTQWSAEAGVAIEPYGLDLSPRLAELARTRLPQWADRIWAGNVMTWEPTRRFDYVRTELGYVPEGRHRRLIERLLDEYLRPGGTVILCSYRSSRLPSPAAPDIAATVEGLGFDVAGEAEAADLNGVIFTRLAWLKKP
jgi:SAM-dependent methyltransferase